MTAPSYRFKFQIVDESTDEVVAEDYCGLTTIDNFGACESVDIHVSSMLRAFQRTGRAEYEREHYHQNAEAAT